MRPHFCHSQGGQKGWRISLDLSSKEENVTYVHTSLARTSHVTQSKLQEGLGDVGEHVEKWKSITVLVTCDKTIENKGKFNIK